ncbi:DNA-binding protein [Streptomyces sp. 142MFCol3.1]|uniref:DNA-binding protein n=1 Tax=Streptomyces sp. 142MFCol3.1 TaxID=1172179 RepID=UPI00048B3F31|nr:DNA-binding protein [Streptomyces sp. 142MFCol3.1]
MDRQNPSAPSRAQSPVPGVIDPTVTGRPAAAGTGPSSGVTHVNVRHTTRYTVIGNHLAQHRELSLTAIGLAAHIQSLPAGARVGIKALADRFPEGETRIAAALRELEAYGYLARSRERLPSGRVVTHTVSYNQPKGLPVPGVPEPAPTPAPAPPAGPAPVLPAPKAPPEAPPPPAPTPPEPRRPKPPLPEPRSQDLPRHRTATALLGDLHRHDSRLLLAERDVRRLAPAVAAWLERGAAPEAVQRTLTAGLPHEPLRHPAALLAHRLTELLPPPCRPAPARPQPFQTCDTCDRAFRAPEPGHCRGCRTDRDVMEAA